MCAPAGSWTQSSIQGGNRSAPAIQLSSESERYPRISRGYRRENTLRAPERRFVYRVLLLSLPSNRMLMALIGTEQLLQGNHCMRRIKRYSNRKFYDTTSRRYVALDGIARMIREGEDVEIVDHTTGKDITAQVLAQVVMDQRHLPLSVSFLTSIIRGSGNLLSDVLDTALLIALHRSEVPTRADLERLHAALDEIEAKIEEIEHETNPPGNSPEREARGANRVDHDGK